MSPSRGPRLARLAPAARRPLSTLRTLSASPTRLQIYLSTAHSPHTNLSLEHHLLRASCAHPHTTQLLLYTNTPSIVLGRNQNPWLEANLPLLSRTPHPQVQLLRRRSGGGTVFHDLGNINYAVVMPTAAFSRDRHAQTVVRALRGLGVASAAVNPRHDIVLLPPGCAATAAEKMDTDAEAPAGTRKVSGSAYKLTRVRSYHHGTMLLSSALESVRALLAGRAGAWMVGRGVGSVRSAVANVGVAREAFVDAVVAEMVREYLGDDGGAAAALESAMAGEGTAELGVCYVSEEEALQVPEIRRGVEELKSPNWTYGQTPQLTFSVPPPEGATGALPEGAPAPPEGARFAITANKGVVERVDSELECMRGLVGLRFDGGVINDHISRFGSAPAGLGEWIEAVLGRTEWGTGAE